MKKPAIMLVEDHGALREPIRQRLSEEFPKFEVVEAVSGEEAVSLAGTVRPTIIVMDIGLPGMNGIEATARIKQMLPETRVIIHSFDSSDASKRNAVDAGASAFVGKDGSVKELIEAVRRFSTPDLSC